MRTSNYIVGLLASAAAHAVLLVAAWPATEAPTVPQADPSPAPVELERLDPPPMPATQAPEPEPTPEPTPEVEPDPEPSLPARETPEPVAEARESLASAEAPPPVAAPVDRLERVAERVAAAERLADDAEERVRAADPDEPALPPLELVWRDAEQLRAVAHAASVRLLVVDRAGAALGELATTGPWRLLAWDGGAPGYSNRVRVMPAAFFGPRLQRLESPTGEGAVTESAGQAAEVWLLVPAELDRRFVAAQLAAIAARGLRPGETALVRGKLTIDQSTGRARLAGVDVIAR